MKVLSQRERKAVAVVPATADRYAGVRHDIVEAPRFLFELDYK